MEHREKSDCCRQSSTPCACGRAEPPRTRNAGRKDTWWLDDVVHTKVGDVPRVKTSLGARDHLGAVRVRWNIGRGQYRVPSGLYAVGDPGSDDPVLVSANYKMS